MGWCPLISCILLMPPVPAPYREGRRIRDIYPSIWTDMMRVYGHGTWVISVTHRGGRTEAVRLYTRWPAVRIDWLSGSEGTEVAERARIYTPSGRFVLERVKRAGTYYLAWWTTDKGDNTDPWALYNSSRRCPFIAENTGSLPFMALSFDGRPLVHILSSEDWHIRVEKYQQHDDRTEYTVRLEHQVPGISEPFHLLLRFDPERHWTLQGWTWWIGEYRKEARACDLRYGRDVDGVPIVEWAKVYLPHYDIVGLEARLISFDPTPPPMDLFRPEAFGIPAPRPSGGSHLWLWAALSALGLLTVLLAARLLAGRRSANAERQQQAGA